MANEAKRSKRILIQSEDDANKDNLKLLQKYERDMQMRELSPKSIYNYKTDLMAWFRYLSKEQFNPSVIDVTEDDIEEFLFYCKNEGNNTERMKRRMASISAFYKFLRRKKLVKENPMEFVPRPKKGLPVVIQTFLTEGQVALMKEKLEALGNIELYTYAMFSLSTMARVNAVSSITWDQIDFEERVVEDVLEKEGKIVNLFFSEQVKDLLLQLKQKQNDNNINSPYVFTTNIKGKYSAISPGTLNDWAKKIGKLIGVESLHPHDFRHSGSQLMSLSGMPIDKISELLNHSGLDVTIEYYLKQDKRKIKTEKDKYSTIF